MAESSATHDLRQALAIRKANRAGEGNPADSEPDIQCDPIDSDDSEAPDESAPADEPDAEPEAEPQGSPKEKFTRPHKRKRAKEERKTQQSAAASQPTAGKSPNDTPRGGNVPDPSTVPPPVQDPAVSAAILKERADHYAREGSRTIQNVLDLHGYVVEHLELDATLPADVTDRACRVAATDAIKALGSVSDPITASVVPIVSSELLAKAKEEIESGQDASLSGGALKKFVLLRLKKSEEGKGCTEEARIAAFDSALSGSTPVEPTPAGKAKSRAVEVGAGKYGPTIKLAGTFLVIALVTVLIAWVVASILLLLLHGLPLMDGETKVPLILLLLIGALGIAIKVLREKYKSPAYDQARLRKWFAVVLVVIGCLIAYPSGAASASGEPRSKPVMPELLKNSCDGVISNGDYSTVDGVKACTGELLNDSRVVVKGKSKYQPLEKMGRKGIAADVELTNCTSAMANATTEAENSQFATCFGNAMEKAFGPKVKAALLAASQ